MLYSTMLFLFVKNDDATIGDIKKCSYSNIKSKVPSKWFKKIYYGMLIGVSLFLLNVLLLFNYSAKRRVEKDRFLENGGK